MRRNVIGYLCDGGRFDSYEDAYKYWSGIAWKERRSFGDHCHALYDDAKKPGWLVVIGKVLAFLVMIATSVVLFITVISALPAFFAATLPAIFADIKALGGWVYDHILKELPLLRGALNLAEDVYEKWIKPTLTWVHSRVVALSESIYAVYNTSVGGLVQAYDSIFGWVDGFQAAVNGALFKLEGLVSVVDQGAADKVTALRAEFNDLISKLFVDWFDKILIKIQDFAGPILTKIGEIEAALTGKIDAVTDITGRVAARQTKMFVTPALMTEETTVVTLHTHHEAVKETVVGKPYTPPESLLEKRKFIDLDKIITANAKVIAKGGGSRFGMIEKGINDVIDQTKGIKLDWEFSIDKSVKEQETDDVIEDLKRISMLPSAEEEIALEETEPEEVV